jgi:protein-disulfide isomerase/uncharacterized membrane protein
MGEGLALAAVLVAAVLSCAGLVWWSPRWGIAATAALGAAASGYLFSRKLDATGPSICNVSDTVNCDLVNSSANSELMGIPIGLLGLGFFVGVLVIAAFASSARHRMFQIVAWLGAVGVAYSVFLAIAAAQLGAVCPLCLTIYACCVLLTVGGWLGARQAGVRLADQWTEAALSVHAVVLVFVFVGIVAIGQSAWSSARARTSTGRVLDALAESDPHADHGDENSVQITDLYARPAAPLPLAGDEPRLGRPDAPITILEFADYGCPHCADAAAVVKDLVRTVPQVQVRFRVFPLSGFCNPILETSGPEGTPLEIGRCRAALAAHCAGSQGKFWEFSDGVFAGQPDLSDERLMAVARSVGVDPVALETCMADPASAQAVREDALAGASLRLQGTPAFFALGLTPEPIEVCGGIQGVLALLQAKSQGIELPVPTQSACAL